MKKKNKLNIKECLIIGNARRLRDKRPTIKGKKQLAEILFTFPEIKKQSPNNNGIYFKLYRYERDGFYINNEILIEKIMEILSVKRTELVSVIKEA